VKKVDAQYCELCQRYLPRLDDLERAQAVHCRSSQHLRLYREQQRKIKAEVMEQEKEKTAAEPEQNGKVCN
jgi:thiol-disulfide isomerase/thioredoxin